MKNTWRNNERITIDYSTLTIFWCILFYLFLYTIIFITIIWLATELKSADCFEKKNYLAPFTCITFHPPHPVINHIQPHYRHFQNRFTNSGWLHLPSLLAGLPYTYAALRLTHSRITIVKQIYIDCYFKLNTIIILLKLL